MSDETHKISVKELDDLIKQCDRNKDGVIDYQEFMALVIQDK